MTTKLYDIDSYMRSFTASVLACEEANGGYAVVLDRTAFFPEEGGQTADGGTLGGARVLNVKLAEDSIVHYTDAPLAVGDTVAGEIFWEERFRKMQNHTAEHMLCGVCHRLWGCENVGFHLGSRDMTADFDRELTREQLMEAERLVNEAIVANVPVFAEYPATDVLKEMTYRAKLALTEGVRIVTVEGVDACACCAPHVSSTGQVGLLKVLDFIRYKGGVRVHLLAGYDAIEDYHRRYLHTAEIGMMLSAKQGEVVEAVAALKTELEKTRYALGGANRRIMALEAAAVAPVAGNLVHFTEETDLGMLRECANLLVEKCGGICAVFGGEEGRYRYVMTSRTVNMRDEVKKINAALSGKGGGDAEMVQGSVSADRATVTAYFEK